MSNISWEKIQRMILNYSFKIDSEKSDYLTCGLCKRIIVDACQIICGCRFCRNCINTYLIDGYKICPNKKDVDCLQVSLNDIKDVHTEKSTNDNVLELKVHCPLNGCDYFAEIIYMVEHIDTCNAKLKNDLFEEDSKIGDYESHVNNNELAKEIGFLRKENERLSIIVDSLMKQIDINDIELFNMKNSIEASKYEPYVWRIESFSTIRTDMKAIYSESFYAMKYGYKVRLAMSPGGDDGKHLGIYFQLLKGEYDPVLKWPFAYNVTFILLSQQVGCIDQIHTISYPSERDKLKYYQKPVKDQNEAYGCHQLIDITTFTSSNIYLKNDAFFVKFSVTNH